MRYLGGHLGALVTPLVDGELRGAEADRAWNHVLGCPRCRGAVESETWVKNSLGCLGAMPSMPSMPASFASAGSSSAWAAVHEVERQRRPGRTARRGLALAGAGTLSLAVFGMAGLGVGLGPSDRTDPGGTDPARPGTRLPTEASFGPTPPSPAAVVPAGAGVAGVGARLPETSGARPVSGVLALLP